MSLIKEYPFDDWSDPLSFFEQLVIFSPKSLLRHPDARTSFDDLVENTSFCRMIPEAGPASQSPDSVKRRVFCTGKIYYELRKERGLRGLDSNVAISRVEQLCPFPWDLMEQEIKKYPNADIYWSQEEHKNQGFWSFIEPHIETIFKNIGRQTELM